MKKKKLLGVLMIFSAIFIFSSTAEAGEVPVHDKDVLTESKNIVDLLSELIKKEFVEDPAAQATAQATLNETGKQVLDFINTGGPDGGPVFVENLIKFKGDLIDKIADDFLGDSFESSKIKDLDSYIGKEVWLSLVQKNNPQKINTTGVAVSDGFRGGNFYDGGWDAWFEMTQNPEKNFLGAYEEKRKELEKRINIVTEDQITKLEWYGGFLPSLDEFGNITTPGNIHLSRLEDVLGSSMRLLEQTDEYQDIVGKVGGIYDAFTGILNDPSSGLRILSSQILGINFNDIFSFDVNSVLSGIAGGINLPGGFNINNIILQ